LNILVVDDEEFARKSLKMALQEAKQHYEIYDAKDGEDAVSQLSETRFDLIISDIRMPKLNGLELVRYVSEHFPELVVILLTGYQDFQYAKKAIEYRVIHFLVKPCPSESILALVEQVEKQLEAERHEQLIHALHGSHLLEKQLSDLLYGIPFPHYYLPLLPAFQCVTLFTVGFTTVDHSKQEWNEQLALSAIKNVGEEWFSPLGRTIILIDNNRLIMIVFVDHADSWDERAAATSFVEIVHSLLKLKVKIGCAERQSNINLLTLSYQQGLQALKSETPCDQATSVLLFKELKGELEQEIESAITVKGKRRVIQHILEQLELRYAEDLTLKGMAEEIYLNASYLGKIFKEDTGKSFNQRLNEVRITVAKKLFQNLTIKVYEVSEQVGFKDPAYFSLMFKRITQMTPHDYQKLIF
jgi:two-component system response regulator YesN